MEYALVLSALMGVCGGHPPFHRPPTQPVGTQRTSMSRSMLTSPASVDGGPQIAPYSPAPETRTLYVNNGSPRASDSGPGTEAVPFKTFKPATEQAMPGDTVMVSSGVYRERVAPRRGGTAAAPITYTAVPGANVVIRASETLTWQRQADGTFKADLPVSLFDTLDGTDNSSLYNPFVTPLQPGVGCNAVTTGQVHMDGQYLDEIAAWQPMADVQNCMIAYYIGRKLKHYHSPNGCFQPQQNGTSLVIQLPDALNTSTTLNDSAVEVTVRSRVFAPHTRGLQFITVKGFTMEYAANNWCANFWDPNNWRYAQSGLLGTRSGYGWTIHNNTFRYAKTIGLDLGIEGGYVPAGGGDNEGTNQPIPNVTGQHTVTNNVIEQNGASGIQGYVASPNFRVTGNVVRNNGHNGCAGAENAAVKLHGLSGTFANNVIVNNTNGVPAWFDSGAHDARISRNVFIVDPHMPQSGGVVFELTDGPVLFDNNIVLGSHSVGSGIASQDAANITFAHNLVAKFASSPAVTLGGLTGRSVNGITASLRSWWIGANVLLATEGAPWIQMHHEKHVGNYELVYNETAVHNVVSGYLGQYPTQTNLSIDVSSNYNATHGAFNVTVDDEGMMLTLVRNAQVSSGCVAGGPGGDIDFLGRARSEAGCMAGPLATLPSNTVVNVSLWAALDIEFRTRSAAN